MTLKIQDAGTLRTITSLKIKQSGVLRTIKTLKVQDGGTLRTVAVFADPLSVSAPNASKTVLNDGPATVTTTCTATVTGGIGPFTYAWTKLSGSFALTNTALAGVTITETVAQDDSSTGSIRVTVTDSLGQTDTDDSTVTLVVATPPIGGTA